MYIFCALKESASRLALVMALLGEFMKYDTVMLQL
jgi:hypothetical protein